MVAKTKVLGPRPTRFKEPAGFLRGRFPDHNLYRRVQHKSAVWPNTSMAAAFLRALAVWAVAHHHDAEAQITLPIGRVTVTELLKVMRALEAARS
jgi:hypothetical protein